MNGSEASLKLGEGPQQERLAWGSPPVASPGPPPALLASPEAEPVQHSFGSAWALPLDTAAHTSAGRQPGGSVAHAPTNPPVVPSFPPGSSIPPASSCVHPPLPRPASCSPPHPTPLLLTSMARTHMQRDLAASETRPIMSGWKSGWAQ